MRLNNWVGRATAEVDDAIAAGNQEFLAGLKGVGPKQASRLLQSGGSNAGIRGYAIQGRVNQLAEGAWGFEKVKPLSRGPDFYATDTGAAWDIHRVGAWQRHVNRIMNYGKPRYRVLYGLHYE